MVTNRDREHLTLSFQKAEGRGSVQETFYPWDMTVNRWLEEGHIPLNPYPAEDKIAVSADSYYLDCRMAEKVYQFEQFLGFDGVKRISLNLPFINLEAEILEETDAYVIRKDSDGWRRKYYKNSELVQKVKPPVTCEEDWLLMKKHADEELKKYYTDENIQRMFSPLKEGHLKGDYSIRLSILGFFWTPRTLFGIEPHLYAFHDAPELMHDINRYILNIYMNQLGKVLDILPADVLYIMEDLSGTNGPMLSPAQFDEFVGTYYKQLVPYLKEKGVRHIFVDTDGMFDRLIPNFIEAGIEGFLPMDVNAGMDIVAVREKYPALKFIGAFNKLEIAKGRDAIDREFERLMPVIRQGGYIPGTDHQVTPSTSFENYAYYIHKLKEVMKDSAM